jgi:hypothetical protein
MENKTQDFKSHENIGSSNHLPFKENESQFIINQKSNLNEL